MANQEMYDYISTVTPDYSSTTLNITPQGVIVEDGSKNVNINEGYGGAEEAAILSSQSVFFVSLQWNAISRADSGTVFDFYHDANKACGIARSFKWLHPTDGHTYVVKFRDSLERFKQNAEIYGFFKFRLKVMGRIAD